MKIMNITVILKRLHMFSPLSSLSHTPPHKPFSIPRQSWIFFQLLQISLHFLEFDISGIFPLFLTFFTWHNYYFPASASVKIFYLSLVLNRWIMMKLSVITCMLLVLGVYATPESVDLQYIFTLQNFCLQKLFLQIFFCPTSLFLSFRDSVHTCQAA